MKTYWMVAGGGMLIAVVGGVVYQMSDAGNGLIIILSGMVVAAMGAVMALIQWGVDKSKKR